MAILPNYRNYQNYDYDPNNLNTSMDKLFECFDMDMDWETFKEMNDHERDEVIRDIKIRELLNE